MAREATYYGVANAIAGGVSLMLPFYGVSRCAVNVIRQDNANTTGNMFVNNIIPKVYAYDSSISGEGPSRYYSFPVISQADIYEPSFSWGLSTTSALVEASTGRAMTFTGGPPLSSSLPVTRLQGKNLMLIPGCRALDTAAPIIAPRDAAGASWSVEAWVFRAAAPAASQFYLETNAGVTQFIFCAINAAGNVVVQTHAAVLATSVATVPLTTWSHVAIVADGAGHITFYINDAAGTPIAYAHGPGIASGTQCLVGDSGTGLYVANCYVYLPALTAASIDRHYIEMTGADFNNGGVFSQNFTMAQGASAQIIFANDALPNALLGGQNNGIWSVILPLQGIGRVQFFAGVYQYEIHTEEMDV